MQPKITIVTVTYNCASLLEATMESVFLQTYPNVEYIIIDGGSTDGTVDLIKAHEAKISCWVSEPDKGIFDAMNKGIGRATGEWINFMNAGDRLASPEVLEKVFEEQLPLSLGCIHGLTCNVSADGRRFLDKDTPFYRKPHYSRGMGFNHQSVFVRTDLARSIGFDLSYRVASDYNMIYSIWKGGKDFRALPFVVSEVDITGFSAQHRRLQYCEVARILGCEHDLRFLLWLNYKSLRSWIKKMWVRWKVGHVGIF